MKLDRVIVRRLQELLEKAEEVESTRRLSYEQEAVDSERFEEWGTSVLSLLQRVFGEESVHYVNFHRHYTGFLGYADKFEDCRGVLRAAKEDFEGGYLFGLRSLVSAELLEDALEQAQELLKADYKDPACVVAGVALETALREICAREGIGQGKLNSMNTELCKAGVYNKAMQKQISSWADHRNNAAHGGWDEYTDHDVEDMIRGVSRFIAENL